MKEIEDIIRSYIPKDIIAIIKELENSRRSLEMVQFPSTQSKAECGKLCQQFQTQYNELEVYRKISDTELISFNVYEYVQNTLRSKRLYKSNKSVRFYRVEHGKKGQCANTDETNELFTINDCLPIIKSIFVNICDNAFKYMPTGSELSIECTQIGLFKEFKFTNLGPALERHEYEEILKPNYRGKNARNLINCSGQGLGLSQIFPILQLHKGWIETSFSVRPSTNTPISINGIPYCNFILVLTFQPKEVSERLESSQKVDDNIGTIPTVMFHNIMQLMSTTIDLYNKSIKFINFDYSVKESLKQSLFHVNNIKFDLLLLQFVYMEQISEGTIYGNDCLINMLTYIKACAASINKELGSESVVVLGDADIKGVLVPTSFYSIFSMLLQIFTKRKTIKTTPLIITLEDDRINIKVEQPAFFDISEFLYETINEKATIPYANYSLIFCLDMLEYNGQEHNINESRSEFYITLPQNK